ncbi:nuclear transport factor 2B-like [Rhodamnia argentea]|uniref:Nuclear transport factor 2B-like n=1 Tax=Rhodamnia argentea TaxID=178133 RepID=A0A8B8QIX7_9MYRT|nr:nuclear transport factor 2B-like [Rhodamnia argentea]
MTTIDGDIMDVHAVAKQFVENFYRTFDANIADLANLYEEDALLILDGRRIQGKEGILAELTSLPFEQCEHHIATISCLRLGWLMVCVHGDIRLDGKEDALPFTQTFSLTPAPQGSFYIAVDVFLMNDHWVQDDGLNQRDSLLFGGYVSRSLH